MASCIGIVSEKYSKWERRVPLTPDHVQSLIAKGMNVLVEPSNKRIFSNREYEQVGAQLTSNLSSADLILGVKQVPEENIIDNKDYLFFSHVIKAQKENMPLLDTLLERQCRLFDYECINEQGQRDRPRLVAFGKFAGIVGMMNSLQALGQAFLSQGVSTPFLSVPLTYMQPDLEEAKDAVRRLGRIIEERGLPQPAQPLVVTFTGNGNVSKGAQEIFSLLPHTFISAEELPSLRERIASGELDGQHQVFGVVCGAPEMVQRADGEPLVLQDYYQEPEGQVYEPVFHQKVLPYTTLLMNCMYWDSRYPRLVTNDQMKRIYHKDFALKVVGDISCDVGGSVEFLTQSTTTEDPFFTYNPQTGESSEGVHKGGVVMMGVDILPAELPKEASRHFGDALLPLLSEFGDRQAEEREQSGEHAKVPLAALPRELQTACILEQGSLRPDYEYINTLRQRRARETVSASSLESKGQESQEGAVTEGIDIERLQLTISRVLLLKGHIFDSKLINHALDSVEVQGGGFQIEDIRVSPNKLSSEDVPTSLFFKLLARDEDHMNSMIHELDELVKVTEEARATLSVIPQSQSFLASDMRGGYKTNRRQSEGTAVFNQQERQTSVNTEGRKVLLLGSGMVSGPVISHFASFASSCPSELTVATNDPPSAISMIDHLSVLPSGIAVTPSITELDASREEHRLRQLVEEHDVVISLLPAHMHLPVARACLDKGTPLVTASYVSPEMRELDAEARAKGVAILNEMGLDPGMDHLAVMEAVDELKGEGFAITEMTSVCGGLSAPEAAEENPFKYKFSWSPLGVLRAAQNSAQYRRDAQKVEVASSDLLSSADPCDFFPTLNLEVLPNRDSLMYGSIYGIEDANTIFRGTLRYQGWSSLMHAFFRAGLLSSEPWDTSSVSTWGDVVNTQALYASMSEGEVERFEEALRFLEMDATRPIHAHELSAYDSPLALTVARMSKHMAMQEGERDLVAMFHRIRGVRKGSQTSGKEEEEGEEEALLTSSLILQGSEDGTTAMAKTVGVTCAIGAQMILTEGKVNPVLKQGGVLTPIQKELYEPALKLLEEQGISFLINKRVVKK